jgi:hypothetical protein
MAETPAELRQLLIEALVDEYPDGFTLNDIAKIADRLWGWMEANYDTPSFALVQENERLRVRAQKAERELRELEARDAFSSMDSPSDRGDV